MPQTLPWLQEGRDTLCPGNLLEAVLPFLGLEGRVRKGHLSPGDHPAPTWGVQSLPDIPDPTLPWAPRPAAHRLPQLQGGVRVCSSRQPQAATSAHRVHERASALTSMGSGHHCASPRPSCTFLSPWGFPRRERAKPTAPRTLRRVVFVGSSFELHSTWVTGKNSVRFYVKP